MHQKIIFLSFIFALVSCSETVQPSSEQEIKVSTSQPIGNHPNEGDRPTIAHVRIADLDQDGLQDVLVCDVLGQSVGWIRQQKDGSYEEIPILENINGAVHAEAIDIDGDTDLDVVIAAMGVILPSDANLGKIIILENDGNEKFNQRIIAENIERVTDVQAGDLDGDGDMDLSVAQFGYTKGRVQWFRNDGDWVFTPQLLINRSGAIHAPIVDIDNDGDLDILALLSQEWETVYAFINDGEGIFVTKILHDVADADFSSSGIKVVDLDQDGDSDVVWTNGDAVVTTDYRPLPTHGLQWLENHGDLEFEFHRIGQMDGAYGPCAIDMDGDGDFDIVTVAEFAYWDNPETRSIVWWEQIEDMQFVPHTIAKRPTHLVTCDVGDMDSNGSADIVVGGMALYPPFEHITRVSLFNNDGLVEEVWNESKSYPVSVQERLAVAKNAGEKGMILQANGFDSRDAYRAAMEEDSQNAKWPFYLGILDLRLGDSTSALAMFEIAEKLDSSYAPLQARIGELYVGMDKREKAKVKFLEAGTDYAKVMLARLEAENGNWPEVIRILDGVDIQAGSALVLTANAILNGDKARKIPAIDMGFQMKDPWLDEVEEECVLASHLVTQAQNDYIAGDINSAMGLLRQAIELDASDKDARLALSNILLRSDQLTSVTLQEAITHLEAGLIADPSYVMTRTKYGWALYLAQRFAEAEEVWTSVIIDEPLHAVVLSNLGQLKLVQKDYSASYEYYKKALSVPEDSPFALSGSLPLRGATLYRFALAAKNLGKKNEALNALIIAADYSPSDAEIQFELGNIYIGMQKFNDALAPIELANAITPDKPRILAALGYTWFNLKNTARAIDFLERSIHLAPTFALAWYHLGNAQLANGDSSAARESFAMAVQLQPKFVPAREALSKLN